MKTTLDLPDELMTALKIRAARENRKLKDIVSDALRRELGLDGPSERRSVRDIRPVSAGGLIVYGETEDRMEDLLDARGHRY